MSIIRKVTSALGHAGYWIGETYCAFSQRVAERFEQVSDTIAEQRYHATSHDEHAKKNHVPPQQVIDITDYRIINGHNHLH